MDVVQALQASLVRTAADLQFYWRDKFQNNPANMITYQGLATLEERAVIRISEVLKNENGIFTLTDELRRVVDLKFHRHALSHPVTIKWRAKESDEIVS